MQNSTLSAPQSFAELRWLRADQEATRRAVAEDNARAIRHKAADFLASATFTRDDNQTLCDPVTNRIVRLTMKVSSPFATFYVTAEKTGQAIEWSAEAPNFWKDITPYVIAAVRDRIQQNRAQRLAQAA